MPIRAQVGWGRESVIDGYAFIYKPDHPNAEASGRVRVHRLVMSEALGRPLRPTETVHHRNGDTLDNRLENLELRIGAHPKGITVLDAIAYATDILAVHAPERLR